MKLSNYIKISSVLLLLFALSNCNDDDDAINLTTQSNYTFVLSDGLAGGVEFINISENADSYSWDFGDGTTSTVINPIKAYDATGDYNVTLTATNTSTGTVDTFSSTVSVFVFDGGLLTNGDFELGTTGWRQGVDATISPALLVTENGNTYYSINVTSAGQPFFVNLSQVGLDMTQDVTYRLTFDAWSDVDRGMLAGIGLSGPPFTNVTETIALTTTPQNYSLDLVANFTDNTNSRIIFDMGAEIGRVNIDNVILNTVQ